MANNKIVLWNPRLWIHKCMNTYNKLDKYSDLFTYFIAQMHSNMVLVWFRNTCESSFGFTVNTDADSQMQNEAGV